MLLLLLCGGGGKCTRARRAVACLYSGYIVMSTRIWCFVQGPDFRFIIYERMTACVRYAHTRTKVTHGMADNRSFGFNGTMVITRGAWLLEHALLAVVEGHARACWGVDQQGSVEADCILFLC